jgi:hypothetical protein
MVDAGYLATSGSDRTNVLHEGADAGVSFRPAYDRPSTLTYTVISSTTDGAWPIVRHLDDRLPALADGHVAARQRYLRLGHGTDRPAGGKAVAAGVAGG